MTCDLIHSVLIFYYLSYKIKRYSIWFLFSLQVFGETIKMGLGPLFLKDFSVYGSKFSSNLMSINTVEALQLQWTPSQGQMRLSFSGWNLLKWLCLAQWTAKASRLPSRLPADTSLLYFIKNMLLNYMWMRELKE